MQGPFAHFAPIILSRRPRVLLRILLKLILALLRAERIRLAAILRLMLRAVVIDSHSTNRISSHCSTPNEFLYLEAIVNRSALTSARVIPVISNPLCSSVPSVVSSLEAETRASGTPLRPSSQNPLSPSVRRPPTDPPAPPQYRPTSLLRASPANPSSPITPRH